MVKIEWKTYDSLIVGAYRTEVSSNCKMACFDIDGTIIETKSGKTHAKSHTDWKLKFNNISTILQKYINQKYKIVFITNQKKLSKGDKFIKEWKLKMEDLISTLNIPLVVFAATRDDIYRKPKTAINDKYLKMTIDSFYCGDAAGRPKREIKDVKYKKDFSDTDAKFARNLNIKFMTPEILFAKINDSKYINVTNIFDDHNINSSDNKPHKFVPSNEKEIILNCGFPGSGKSRYAKEHIVDHGYEYINQDTLKTFKKCEKAAIEAMKNDKNIIIDNTNLSDKKRKIFIDLANKYDYKVRLLLFDTPLEICKHNAHYRNVASNNKISPIDDKVYRFMKPKYVIPNKKEGIDEIETIPFCISNPPAKYYEYMY